MLDKIKGTIQSQFDQWYANIHARGGNITPGVAADTSKNESNSRREKDFNKNNDNNKHNDNQKNYQNDIVDNNHHDNGSQSLHSRSSSRTEINTNSKNKTTPSENQNFDSLVSTMTSISTTGKKSISLDADSDILAFYQAREELLKHRAAK